MVQNKVDKLLNKIKTLDISEKDKNIIIELINNIKDEEINKINKKPKKDKDPNIPKKPKNSYMLFMDDIRKIKDNKKPSTNFPSNNLDKVKDIINNNKGKPITSLSKDCGKLWKLLTNDDKIKYENIYKNLQNKYKKEMEKYKNNLENK